MSPADAARRLATEIATASYRLHSRGRRTVALEEARWIVQYLPAVDRPAAISEIEKAKVDHGY